MGYLAGLGFVAVGMSGGGSRRRGTLLRRQECAQEKSERNPSDEVLKYQHVGTCVFVSIHRLSENDVDLRAFSARFRRRRWVGRAGQRVLPERPSTSPPSPHPAPKASDPCPTNPLSAPRARACWSCSSPPARRMPGSPTTMRPVRPHL